MSPRILMVADARETAGLVRTLLEQSGYEVLVAHDGETALRIARRECPDLMLLDLVLPGREGTVDRDVKLAAMPLIMLTGRVGDQNQIVGLELDAGGIGFGPFDLREAVDRVQAALRHARGDPAAVEAIRIDGLVIDRVGRRAVVDGRPLPLTPTEFSLLLTLAERPGSTLTRLELIQKGLGDGYAGVERTVDSHVKNLRRKLDAAAGKAYLVETVFGIGYRLAEGETA